MAPSNNIQDPFATEGLVALLMLDFATEGDDNSLTPLQINKLVYISHGWVLGFFQRPLIENRVAQIEAWRYGPVVVGIYHMLKSFGSRPVNMFNFYSVVSQGDGYYDANLFPVSGESKPSILSEFKENQTEVTKALRWVYRTYTQDYTAEELIALTHQEGTPWHQCYRPSVLRRWGLANNNAHIPDSIIKSYYKKRIKRSQ